MISGPFPPADAALAAAPPSALPALAPLPNPLPAKEAETTERIPASVGETADKLTAAVADPDSAEQLIPVRMLNEFSYCPRLAYLEHVQGEWADNLETLQGTFGHRNVDKPDRKQFAAPAKSVAVSSDGSSNEGDLTGQADSAVLGEEKIHARSIMLSAEGEGLLAKLDLLEIEGTLATPVDYKRGQAPDIPEGAYEPERVQLCAQGLILRDNGYQCTQGVIYFIASKRRVVIEFDDALVTRTRQLVQEFKATASAGICPPPLVDSPKCPRCSLVGICLPDETNLLRLIDTRHSVLNAADVDDKVDGVEDSIEGPESTTPTSTSTRDGLRRLMPRRDNALPLYVQNQGAMVGKSGDRITIKLKGEQLASVRLLDVSQLCIFGNVMLTAHAVSELTSRGVPICHYSYGGWFHSLTTGLVHKNVELRIRQYAIAADAQAALAIARQLIAGKIKNSRTLLRRHLDDSGSPILRQLAEYHRRAADATSAESLLGLEGMAAKEYFSGFLNLFPEHADFDVNGRNRRPPRDPVNAVLSFVYSLLTKEVTIVLQAIGFDPMLGVFHRPRYGRPSLALDLAEEFRPLIADSVTLTVFNNGEVGPESFIRRAGAVALTDAGRRSVISAYERRLETEITHPIFGYKVCYRRILEVQARLLARHMLGEFSDYPSFETR